jgi:hypothetical protein
MLGRKVFAIIGRAKLPPAAAVSIPIETNSGS